MSRANSLATAILVELPFDVAVLDEDGDVRFTNRAWREFAAEPQVGVTETNHFAAIDTTDDVYAERAAVGLQSVLDGRRNVFTWSIPATRRTPSSGF